MCAHRPGIARGAPLVNQPRLILADEPTGNLDSEHSQEVLGLLRRSNLDQGTTVVLVTHDAEVGTACDRIIRMRDGKIRELISVPPREPDLADGRVDERGMADRAAVGAATG